jgi:hypothetical protein
MEQCKKNVQPLKNANEQPSWALGCVIKFLQMNKARVVRKEITKVATEKGKQHLDKVKQKAQEKKVKIKTVIAISHVL